MNLSQRHIDILNAKVCPYCNSSTRVVDEVYIYGRSYKDRLMICCKNYPTCDAYVGTHDDGEPLGRLANKNLREMKIKAHNAFDKIWKENKMNRGEAYEKLADYLGLPDKYTHIGMFNPETCMKVVAWSTSIYNDL